MPEREPGNNFLTRTLLKIHERHVGIQTERDRMLSLELRIEADQAHALNEGVMLSLQEIKKNTGGIGKVEISPEAKQRERECLENLLESAAEAVFERTHDDFLPIPDRKEATNREI